MFRKFLILWSGQFVSVLGSELTAFAIGVWIYQQSSSLSRYAIFSVLSLFPVFFLAPLSGVIIDRVNRRLAILMSDLGTAICILTIFFLSFYNKLEIWHIYIILPVTAVFSSMLRPAYEAAIAQLVPDNRLGRANGLYQLSESVPEIVCPLLGSLILFNIGLHGVVLTDFITFIVGIACTLSISLPDLHQVGQRTPLTAKSILSDLIEAVECLKEEKGLSGFFACLVLISFLVAVGRIVFIPYILSFAPKSMLGVYLAIGGGAMVATSVLISYFGHPKRLVNGIGKAMILLGFGIILLCCRTSAMIFCSGIICLYAGLALYFSYSITFWQLKIEKIKQGRILAFRISLSNLACILAYLLTGSFVDRVLTPALDHNAVVKKFFLTELLIGTSQGISMGYVLLTVGLMVITCGIFVCFNPCFLRLYKLAVGCPQAENEARILAED